MKVFGNEGVFSQLEEWLLKKRSEDKIVNIVFVHYTGQDRPNIQEIWEQQKDTLSKFGKEANEVIRDPIQHDPHLAKKCFSSNYALCVNITTTEENINRKKQLILQLTNELQQEEQEISRSIFQLYSNWIGANTFYGHEEGFFGPKKVENLIKDFAKDLKIKYSAERIQQITRKEFIKEAIAPNLNKDLTEAKYQRIWDELCNITQKEEQELLMLGPQTYAKETWNILQSLNGGPQPLEMK
eukprot:CAMPEP_0168574538 /NCGR_PEP_ID=MMETSP0413-20121227/19136_1 /TAXON_ID=136452 /ORGANISM="Filamoeba nolandi, Strain NC-AS-23-1" /LENGTH=240 /DNA_ID=CAMNT_0008607891 /DNA_START=405 /DNA_END=1127 /DNA_ORIENTATION=+